MLIFDNTPLSHFARAGTLSALHNLAAGHRCVVPAEVVKELIAGIPIHPAIGAATNQPWLEIVELTEIEEVVSFARYKAELGGGVDHNNGESAVLAWAHVHGGTAIIDERAGTRAARRDGIDVHGTTWLIVNALRDNKISRSAAITMVDQLRATDMALPTDGAGFLAWAYENGLLP